MYENTIVNKVYLITKSKYLELRINNMSCPWKKKRMRIGFINCERFAEPEGFRIFLIAALLISLAACTTLDYILIQIMMSKNGYVAFNEPNRFILDFEILTMSIIAIGLIILIFREILEVLQV
jgi:hypothetical protein